MKGTFHDLLYPESGLVADHKAFIKKQAAGIARRYGLDPVEVESRAIAIATAAARNCRPDGSFEAYLLVRFKELHRVYSETHLLVPTGVTRADIKAEKLEAGGERVDIEFPGDGPRLYIDRQWQRMMLPRLVFNEYGRGAELTALATKRIVVGIQLKLAGAAIASMSALRPTSPHWRSYSTV